MIDVEKPAVKSDQETVDEKQEKELASTENISVPARDATPAGTPGLPGDVASVICGPGPAG